MKQLFQRSAIVAILVATLLAVLPLDVLAQRSRGGGSFGGSRGSRSYSMPRSSRPSGGGSFGGSRSTRPSSTPRSSPNYSTSPSRTTSTPRATTNSFGGSRMTSASDYTSRYGMPRQTTRQAVPGTNGQSYVVNRYGGMGDGFMMGYMMGSIPWYWSMPFHPAFYYSRPVTVANPDGTTAVYPGTFQWGTLFFTLLVIGGLLFIAYVWIKNRRRRQQFGGGENLSQSSFG